MARTDTLTHYLTDIADAIREKTGSSDPIQASSFDTAIENIPSGGGGIDWSEIGYSTSPKFLVDGFNYAKEIYDNWDSSLTSLSQKYANDLDMVIMPMVDTSNVTNFYGAFSGCKCLQSIPQLDTSNATRMGNMFYMCYGLKNLPMLDGGKVTDIQDAFSICQSLTNFGGVKDLGKSYSTNTPANASSCVLNLSHSSNLTHDSLMNVINNLYDIKTKGCNNQKLTLGSTNLAKLTAEEIAIATDKGWNVT